MDYFKYTNFIYRYLFKGSYKHHPSSQILSYIFIFENFIKDPNSLIFTELSKTKFQVINLFSNICILLQYIPYLSILFYTFHVDYKREPEQTDIN